MPPSGTSCASSRNRWKLRAARASVAPRSRTRTNNDRASRAVPTTAESVPEAGVQSPSRRSHREMELSEHAETGFVPTTRNPVLVEGHVDACLAVGEEEPGDAEPGPVAVHVGVAQGLAGEDEVEPLQQLPVRLKEAHAPPVGADVVGALHQEVGLGHQHPGAGDVPAAEEAVGLSQRVGGAEERVVEQQRAGALGEAEAGVCHEAAQPQGEGVAEGALDVPAVTLLPVGRIAEEEGPGDADDRGADAGGVPDQLAAVLLG